MILILPSKSIQLIMSLITLNDYNLKTDGVYSLSRQINLHKRLYNWLHDLSSVLV